MAQAARLPLDASDFPISRPTPQAPAQAAGLMSSPGGQPLGAQPLATPQEPPFNIVMQADGSSYYTTKGNPPLVLGKVTPPPKLPPSLQPQAPQGPM